MNLRIFHKVTGKHYKNDRGLDMVLNVGDYVLTAVTLYKILYLGEDKIFTKTMAYCGIPSVASTTCILGFAVIGVISLIIM